MRQQPREAVISPFPDPFMINVDDDSKVKVGPFDTNMLEDFLYTVFLVVL